MPQEAPQVIPLVPGGATTTTPVIIFYGTLLDHYHAATRTDKIHPRSTPYLQDPTSRSRGGEGEVSMGGASVEYPGESPTRHPQQFGSLILGGGT